MIGIYYLHIQNDSFINFNINFGSLNSFNITSTNNGSLFYLSFIMFFTYYCSYITPYYYFVDGNCYDICPDGTFSNMYALECIKCPYDCQTCDMNGSCLSCNHSNFRFLNTTTNRCVPARGYFESGSAQASACQSDCVFCEDDHTCYELHLSLQTSSDL